MNTYIPRLQDAFIQELLGVFGAVIISGAKATGKTTTGLHHAASSVRLDASPGLSDIAQTAPASILQGAAPRLVDEWQLAPAVWNAIRYETDMRRKPGQFIVTSSATPREDVTHHTGAGRFGRVTIRTLTLAETGDSTKQVSFSTLMADDSTHPVVGYGGLKIPDIANRIVMGGWPAFVGGTERAAALFHDFYIDDISRVSIPSMDEAVSPPRMRAFIRSLARNIATECSITKLASEAELDDGSLSEKTARKYLDLLERIFVLEPLPAWGVALRSNIRRRVAPKWHFVDPAIAVAALGASGAKLLAAPESFGFFFKSLAIRDLRVYAERTGADIYHYRDETGLAVDAIAEDRRGNWAAFEVKLGAPQNIAAGIAALQALQAKVTERRRAQCCSLNIITAGDISYTDKTSGINVIALTHLTA